MLALLFIPGFILGFVAGVLIVRSNTRKIDGILRVDTSDPDDNPYMFLELSKSVNAIMNSKVVVLEVSTKNFIPQK